MSEEIWLAVEGRLVRARPIVVYEPVSEEPAPQPTPLVAAVETPKKNTTRFGVRYSPEQKASILAEANMPGAFDKHIAQKYGISPSSITHWRKQATKAKKLARKAS